GQRESPRDGAHRVRPRRRPHSRDHVRVSGASRQAHRTRGAHRKRRESRGENDLISSRRGHFSDHVQSFLATQPITTPNTACAVSVTSTNFGPTGIPNALV